MVYIILAMVFYAAAIIFGAAASRNTNTNVAAAVTNIVSAIIPVVAIIPILTKKLVVNQKLGIIFAVIGGVLIAFFVMSLNKAYEVNRVGIVAPIVFGGAIFLSTFASYFVFKEKITAVQLIGLILLGLGLGFIVYARGTEK
jgi:uncharacterized membrane protein